MKTRSIACLVLALLVALLGCKSSDSGEKKASKEEARLARQAEIKAALPPDSPLAKVDFGMSEGEVGALLGPPDSQDTHTTGKQFIPFNFAGKDTLRTVFYFKGVGRVEFSAGSWGQRNGVVSMEADPAEPGYRQSKKK